MRDTYRFGHCELNPVRRRLLVSGKSAEVGPRAFDVLVALVERAGELVTKDELLSKAWPNLVVEENNLSQQVHALRRVIGAEAIATVPSLGYRLTIPLTGEPGPREEITPSIAVLPFEDLSAERNQEFFADGLAEEVLNALAKVRSLRVVSRTSAFSFKGRQRDIPEIARRLAVSWIVEGSVRKAGRRIRVSAQLVRVASDSQAWAGTFDRDLEDIFAVQDEIAKAVVREIRPALLSSDDGNPAGQSPGMDMAALARGRSGDFEAHRLFLLGRFLAEKANDESVAAGISHLRQAVERDPACALAWAALARAYASIDEYELARQAATKALEVEPDLAEGHSALAWVQFSRDWDWASCDASNRRALELEPGNAEIAREAAYQATDVERGLALARRAVVLDPLSSRAMRTLSLRCVYAGLLPEAERWIREALTLFPGIARTSYHLGRVLLLQGRFQEALEAFEGEVEIAGRAWGVPLALHSLGRPEEAIAALERLIAEHSASSAYQVADAYAWMNRKDDAFRWLERAVQQRDPGVTSLLLDPLLENLRGDARWTALLKRLKLASTRVHRPALPAREEAIASIAVLPFEDSSAARDQEFFADGLAEEVLNALARVPLLRVISRASAFTFKGQKREITEVARRLRVEWVLEGSVRGSGNRIHVAAQLVRAPDGSSAWSQTYDRAQEDIFAVQDEIVRAVVKAVRPSLPSPSLRGPSRDPEAHRLYLHGRFLAAKSIPAEVEKGLAYLKQALEREPAMAIGWATLARAHATRASFAWEAPQADEFERARRAATRAIELGPDVAEGYSALASVQFTFDWDWKGSGSSIRRALELAPGNAEILREAAFQEASVGTPESAVALARRAVDLDPLNLQALRMLGLRCLDAGLLDEAEQAMRSALELFPTSQRTRHHLGRILLLQGRADEAMAAFESEPDEDLRLHGRLCALHALGRAAEARAALEAFVAAHPDAAPQLAEAYAFMGDPDEAFRWLETSLAQHEIALCIIKTNPMLRSLHADARWKPFLKRIDLA